MNQTLQKTITATLAIVLGLGSLLGTTSKPAESKPVVTMPTGPFALWQTNGNYLSATSQTLVSTIDTSCKFTLSNLGGVFGDNYLTSNGVVLVFNQIKYFIK